MGLNCTSRRKLNLNVRKLIYLTVVVLVALNFVLVPDQEFYSVRDRLNYTIYAFSTGLLDENWHKGITVFLTNEPLFLFLNKLLFNYFSSTTVVKIFIFFSYVVTNWILLKETKYTFFSVVLYTLMPQAVKANVMVIRQGVAVALYLWGYTSSNGYIKKARFLAPFIHTSSSVFILVELYDYLFTRIKMRESIKLIFFSLCAFLSAFVVPSIFFVLGDRRATQYSFQMDKTASGLSFLFWGIFLIFILKYGSKNKFSKLTIYGIIIYLSTYFTLDISARLFEGFLPIIILFVLVQKNKTNRRYMILALCFYSILGWYVNSGIQGWMVN